MLKIIHKHKIILNNFFILNTSFFIIVLCQIIGRVITNIRWYKNGVIIHAVFIYGVFRFIANCFTCNSLFLANSSSRHLGHLVSVFDRLLSCVCHEWPFLHFHHTGTELLALTVSGVKGRFFSSSHSSNKYCFFSFLQNSLNVKPIILSTHSIIWFVIVFYTKCSWDEFISTTYCIFIYTIL